MNVQKLEPSCIAGGNVNGAVTLERGLANSYIVSYPMTQQLGIYLRKMKTFIHTNTCMQIYGPKMEATQMSINW